MKQSYLELILLIERLHRRFLDVVKSELDRLGIEDVNNVQTLILYNIGSESITIGELTNRGYYLGSNVSYNIKKLVENEYIMQERSPHDKRSVKVKLSQKGLSLCEKVDALYQNNTDALISQAMTEEQLNTTNQNLKALEAFWSKWVKDFS